MKNNQQDLREKRRYLESYQDLLQDFIRERDDFEYWRALAYSISATTLDPTGVPNTSHSNFRPVDKYLEISERCKERSEELDEKKREIIDAVNQLDERYERAVLKLHYIDDIGFHDISNKLFLNLDYVYRLHIRGLKNFVIPEK